MSLRNMLKKLLTSSNSCDFSFTFLLHELLLAESFLLMCIAVTEVAFPKNAFNHKWPVVQHFMHSALFYVSVILYFVVTGGNKHSTCLVSYARCTWGKEIAILSFCCGYYWIQSGFTALLRCLKVDEAAVHCRAGRLSLDQRRWSVSVSDDF